MPANGGQLVARPRLRRGPIADGCAAQRAWAPQPLALHVREERPHRAIATRHLSRMRRATRTSPQDDRRSMSCRPSMLPPARNASLSRLRPREDRAAEDSGRRANRAPHVPRLRRLPDSPAYRSSDEADDNSESWGQKLRSDAVRCPAPRLLRSPARRAKHLGRPTTCLSYPLRWARRESRRPGPVRLPRPPARHRPRPPGGGAGPCAPATLRPPQPSPRWPARARR